MCSGLNLPLGSHHSLAIASNLATSAASTVLVAPCIHGSIIFLKFRPVTGPGRQVYRTLMDKVAGQKSAGQFLYPQVDPFDQRMMDVGDGHRIYVEQCGNPDGVPVIVLHGGPGGGCSPAMRRYFDPAHYRIILFDQRGCGRSRPHASIEANTTWHLVRDIEAIRKAMGVTRWVVFGGSWGATLGLIYAQTHPGRVLHLVLRGVFLMTQRELDWFYGGGAGQFWPDVWQRFVEIIPEDERGDLIRAYHRRLFSGDLMLETRFARAWASWENTLASIENDGPGGESPAEYARAFARLENHYFINAGFLEQDGQILRNMDHLADVPGTIVQGRYDMICPPVSAQRLHEAWPKSRLVIVPRAGHALSEPGISAELVRTTDQLRRTLRP
jgi:proline iminopeptidase